MHLVLANILSARTLLGWAISCVFFVYLYLVASTAGGNLVGDLFSGFVALVAVSSGFVGAFYFFLASRSTQFLERAQGTRAFNDLLALVRHAFVVSVISIAFCLRCLVVSQPLRPDFFRELSLRAIADRESVFVLLTILLLGYVMGTFWRCMNLFDQLAR